MASEEAKYVPWSAHTVDEKLDSLRRDLDKLLKAVRVLSDGSVEIRGKYVVINVPLCLQNELKFLGQVIPLGEVATSDAIAIQIGILTEQINNLFFLFNGLQSELRWHEQHAPHSPG